VYLGFLPLLVVGDCSSCLAPPQRRGCVRKNMTPRMKARGKVKGLSHTVEGPALRLAGGKFWYTGALLALTCSPPRALSMGVTLLLNRGTRSYCYPAKERRNLNRTRRLEIIGKGGGLGDLSALARSVVIVISSGRTRHQLSVRHALPPDGSSSSPPVLPCPRLPTPVSGLVVRWSETVAGDRHGNDGGAEKPEQLGRSASGRELLRTPTRYAQAPPGNGCSFVGVDLLREVNDKDGWKDGSSLYSS
jgi:hypothetical protein